MDNINSNFIIKITTNCPCKCPCCTNRRNNMAVNNYTKSFDIKIFERICSCIKAIGGKYLCLSGGEPTIVPNLCEFISIANKIGLSVRLNTNGFGVTQGKLDSWFAAGLDQIVLSIYGMDKDVVAKARGNLLIFERSLKAAELLGECKNRESFIFIIQTVIMKTTYKQIPQIFELALKNNADLFWASYLEDAIHLDEIRMEPENINEYKAVMVPAMKRIAKQFKRVNIGLVQTSLDGYYKDPYPNYLYHKTGENCSWIGNHFTFYPDGRVDPCPGHEYFQSEFQWKIDYNNVEDFITLENLCKYRGEHLDYCQYCPQGVHQEVCLRPEPFHEHSKKEEVIWV